MSFEWDKTLTKKKENWSALLKIGGRCFNWSWDMQRGLGLFLCLLFLECWWYFIKSILIQSNNNSNAIWPRAEADGEPLIRMKTCDRFVFYCWCWWARGGGGVRRTSHFQKKTQKQWQSMWTVLDENNSSIWLFNFDVYWQNMYSLRTYIFKKSRFEFRLSHPSVALPVPAFALGPRPGFVGCSCSLCQPAAWHSWKSWGFSP